MSWLSSHVLSEFTIWVSENNVDIRFRINGIEKIVEELTSQGKRFNG